jgi:hypothetical protein
MDFEIIKVDKSGKIPLPGDWLKTELKDANEVIIVKGKGILKIYPYKKVNLTSYFDKVDLGIDIIDDWTEFEKKFYWSSNNK